MIKQVPLNTVIANKIILQANPDTTIDDLTVCNDLRLEAKVISFNRIEFDRIDKPKLIDPYIFQQSGRLWLLELLVKNLGAKKVSSSDIYSTFAVIDYDDYVFDPVLDDHLTHNSKFSVQSGLYDTYWKSYPQKIESVCMLLFYLPDEDEQEYFLYNKGGYFDDI